MDEIFRILNDMNPISLDEMKSVRLMNRIDTKYVVTEPQLLEILSRVRDVYFSQAG